MTAELKSEIKKLLTVRSTYFIFGIASLLVLFFSFYVSGWHIMKPDLLDPSTLASDVTGAIAFISIFSALTAMLLVTHEYRYNTIMYTLTSSNNRNKVLLAKILVTSCFAVLFTAFFGILSPLVSLLGIHAHHLHLVPQTLHYRNLIWRGLFYGWGYTMAGVVIATLIRSQVGAIVTLFIVPGTVEGLLGLLLKQNTVYLPFSALRTVIIGHSDYASTATPGRAALTFGIYLLVAWAIAWVMFLRRDAN